MKIMTTQGPLDREALDIRDIVKWSDNAREVATEYHYKGELVKRSVHIDVCMPLTLAAAALGAA